MAVKEFALGHVIRSIHIDELRALRDLQIVLPERPMQHLLLTGSNGCGKSALLLALRQRLTAITDGQWHKLKLFERKKAPGAAQKSLFEKYSGGVRLDLDGGSAVDTDFAQGEFITAYFGAERQALFEPVHAVEEVILPVSCGFDAKPASLLLRYMVHLKTQQAYARQEGDTRLSGLIDAWFEQWQTLLCELFNDWDLALEYDFKRYRFLIRLSNREPFGFDALSGGYAAVMAIIADLIMRMEPNWLSEGMLPLYDCDGVVLIDEPEAHLHEDLKIRLLPILTQFFPNLQFIVATHEPRLLSSKVEDEVLIYDLDRRSVSSAAPLPIGG